MITPLSLATAGLRFGGALDAANGVNVVEPSLNVHIARILSCQTSELSMELGFGYGRRAVIRHDATYVLF